MEFLMETRMTTSSASFSGASSNITGAQVKSGDRFGRATDLVNLDNATTLGPRSHKNTQNTTSILATCPKTSTATPSA